MSALQLKAVAQDVGTRQVSRARPASPCTSSCGTVRPTARSPADGQSSRQPVLCSMGHRVCMEHKVPHCRKRRESTVAAWLNIWGEGGGVGGVEEACTAAAGV